MEEEELESNGALSPSSTMMCGMPSSVGASLVHLGFVDVVFPHLSPLPPPHDWGESGFVLQCGLPKCRQVETTG